MNIPPINYSVSFDNSNQHYKPVIKMVDTVSKEQIKQIPPEERIRLAEHIGNSIDIYA
jgi:uncharacterized FlaG/YvyC family protein